MLKINHPSRRFHFPSIDFQTVSLREDNELTIWFWGFWWVVGVDMFFFNSESFWRRGWGFFGGKSGKMTHLWQLLIITWHPVDGFASVFFTINTPFPCCSFLKQKRSQIVDGVEKKGLMVFLALYLLSSLSSQHPCRNFWRKYNWLMIVWNYPSYSLNVCLEVAQLYLYISSPGSKCMVPSPKRKVIKYLAH